MGNELMNLKKFEELAEVHQPHCVSIYIPTHRAGRENYEEDRIRFKDLLKSVKEELTERYGLSEDETDQYLKPVQDRVEDSMFWSYSGDGLAFFLSPQGVEFFRMPISFEPFYHISDHFYLHPILPFFQGDGRFYVLGVSEKKVRLWEGSRYRIREVALEEELPSRIEEVFGYDHEEKTLQERSFQGSSSQTVSHGHGEGKDEEKVELEKFLRELDRQLSGMLRDEQIPLVFCGLEHYFGLYKKVAHYRKLEENDLVKGDPASLEAEELHSKAWDIVRKEFDEDLEHYIQQYKDHMGGLKAAYDNGRVVQASVEGRVEALFIESGSHIYGLYDSQDQSLRFDELKKPDNDDLVEVAAMNAYRKGGRVFVLSSERMPESGTELNALLRY